MTFPQKLCLIGNFIDCEAIAEYAMRHRAPKMSELGKYLRRCRESAGLTQSQVAQRLRPLTNEEIATWYVNKVETGRIRQPDIARLRPMADVVGADFSEALRLGGYPGYQMEAPGDGLPPLIRGRLTTLSTEELEALDELWPAIEDLLKRAVDLNKKRHLGIASAANNSETEDALAGRAPWVRKAAREQGSGGRKLAGKGTSS
jgi:transcriptional regulator with XRE-family HTH domain